MADSASAEPNDTPDFRQYEGLFSEYAKEISVFPNDVLTVSEEKKQLRALDRTLFVRPPPLVIVLALFLLPFSILWIVLYVYHQVMQQMIAREGWSTPSCRRTTLAKTFCPCAVSLSPHTLCDRLFAFHIRLLTEVCP